MKLYLLRHGEAQARRPGLNDFDRTLTGYGRTDGRWHLTTNWNGTQVNGSISSDGNTIYWDNGTTWTR